MHIATSLSLCPCRTALTWRMLGARTSSSCSPSTPVGSCLGDLLRQTWGLMWRRSGGLLRWRMCFISSDGRLQKGSAWLLPSHELLLHVKERV